MTNGKYIRRFFENLNGNLFSKLNQYAKETYGYSLMALVRNCKMDVDVTEIQYNSTTSLNRYFELVDEMATNI